MENLPIIQNQIRLTVLVLASLAVILGFKKFGFKVYQTTLVMALLSPFIWSFIKQLPLWLFIPAVIIIVGFMFRKIVGAEAFGHFFGAILYDVFWKLPLTIIVGVGKGIRKIYRSIFQ